MELNKWKRQLTFIYKQYKYVLLVAAAGLLLMLIPQSKKEAQQVITQVQENILTVEEQLGAILSQVDGAGEVRVLLTQASGEETLYQTDQDYDTSAELHSSRTDTVTITDAERNETGLVRQVNPPVYLGAIVVCEGADNPVVQLSIVEAVCKVTGLGADKISVLKMG